MSQPQANAMPAQDTELSKWWKLAYFLPLIVAVAVLATHFIFYRKFLFCSCEVSHKGEAIDRT